MTEQQLKAKREILAASQNLATTRVNSWSSEKTAAVEATFNTRRLGELYESQISPMETNKEPKPKAL